MYQVGGWLERFGGRGRATSSGGIRGAVSLNVLFLGLTSLFTDISSEMVVSILPVYLVGFLRMSPAQFGLIDGLYQGIGGVMQLVSAMVADRVRRYKEVAGAGYAASLLSRVGLLATSGAGGIATFLVLDRLGKGVRTAPRDALISFSAPPAQLGTAFGVHRAMDAMGAMLGPIVAFIILWAIADGFDVVFVFSLCSAVIGLAVLVLFVENGSPGAVAAEAGAVPASASNAAALLRDPAFRYLTLSAFVLGLMTISDGFVYLTLQRRANLSAGAFPLLYVATSAFFLIFAIPMGRLADAIGRFRVFLGGHAVLVVLYTMLASTGLERGLLIISLPMLGLYYAATEGVLMSVGSTILPEPIRTSGLAVLATAVAAARLGGSVMFGMLWSRVGLEAALVTFLIGLVAAGIGIVLARPRGRVRTVL
jgi:MFS family permease